MTTKYKFICKKCKQKFQMKPIEHGTMSLSIGGKKLNPNTGSCDGEVCNL